MAYLGVCLAAPTGQAGTVNPGGAVGMCPVRADTTASARVLTMSHTDLTIYCALAQATPSGLSHVHLPLSAVMLVHSARLRCAL